MLPERVVGHCTVFVSAPNVKGILPHNEFFEYSKLLPTQTSTNGAGNRLLAKSFWLAFAEAPIIPSGAGAEGDALLSPTLSTASITKEDVLLLVHIAASVVAF